MNNCLYIRKVDLFSIIIISYSFIFLVSYEISKDFLLFHILFFSLMLSLILLIHYNKIYLKINLLISSFMTYLIFYFFIESIFFNSEDFYIKQKLVVIFKLSIFYISSVFVMYTPKLEKKHILYYSYCCFLLMLFSINNLSIMEKSIYFLNSFMPIFILFYILQKLEYKKVTFKIFNLFIWFYFLSLLISIFIMFNLIHWETDFFYKLYENSPFALVNDLPRTWFTTFLGLDLFRRFNGTLADPIIFGYISATVLLIITYSKDKKILIYPIVLFFLLSSLSKGSYALYILVVALNIVGFKFYYKNIFYWLLFVLICVMGLAFGSLGKGSSVDIHFLGLVFPFLNLLDYSMIEILIGHGFTSGGNLAKGIGIVNESNWLQTGAESGIGTIFYQTGLLGLLFVIIIFYKQIQKSKLYAKNFITIYFVLMFTQENLINMNYLMLLFIGVIFLNKLERKSNVR